MSEILIGFVLGLVVILIVASTILWWSTNR